MHVINEISTQNKLNDLAKYQAQEITFKCHTHTPEESQDVWTHHIIEIYKSGTAAGYIKMTHYEPSHCKYKIENVLDYFVMVKSNKNPASWFEHKNSEFFDFMGQKEPLKYIEDNYQAQYMDFLHKWHQKPTVEIVKVYDESYNKHYNFADWPAQKEDRTPINHQKMGLGKELHFAMSLWMEDLKLLLWQSSNQTDEGKNMWLSMAKHPSFKICCETLTATLNNHTAKMERNYLKIF